MPGAPRVGALDRDAVVETVLSRLGARRSAWNAADIRGEVEQWIAGTGLVADAAVRIELAEDLTARALDACVPLLHRAGRARAHPRPTSPQVLAVEADLVTRLIDRAEQPADTGRRRRPDRGGRARTSAQRAAVASLAGTPRWWWSRVRPGRARPTPSPPPRTLLARAGPSDGGGDPDVEGGQGRRPRDRHRRVLGGVAGPPARLAVGRRRPLDPRSRSTPAPEAVLRPGDLLLVDEAGMLDQDTARALLTLADETGARVALVGDRHQLPAVGRGGVLDLAARWVPPEAHVVLDVVHRFTDPEYAALSLAMRTGTNRGQDAGERIGERWW